MNFEKILFIAVCYFEGLILNIFVAPMLDGLNQIVWLIFNIWIWVFAPIIILRANEKEKEKCSKPCERGKKCVPDEDKCPL